jgi:hypothetical protein
MLEFSVLTKEATVKYKVVWSKTKLIFDDSKGEVKYEYPGMMRSKVQIASYSAITGVVYGIGALASHGVGVEVSGAGVWWVPCVFKGVKKDGQEFAHALGKAAGLRLLGAPENGSWEIAYGK